MLQIGAEHGGIDPLFVGQFRDGDRIQLRQQTLRMLDACLLRGRIDHAEAGTRGAGAIGQFTDAVTGLIIIPVRVIQGLEACIGIVLRDRRRRCLLGRGRCRYPQNSRNGAGCQKQ